MTARLVILLHGVNARGRDVAYVARDWRLPDTAIAVPDAPEVSDENPDARQWFSIAGATPENRPARVRAARPAFDRLLAETIAAHGLTGRPDRVALVGFSQGAIMALDAVASGRWPVAAAVAFSGRFATSDAVALTTPVLVVHGRADPAIPFAESLNARACLAAQGCPVDFSLEPDTAHCVSPAGAARAVAFLRRAFALSPGENTPG